MRSEKQKADTEVCWQNHFLFSSDHIGRVLPRSPYWAALLSRVQVASEKLQLLYNSFNNELSNLDAETLASQWVRPMLAILGQNLISSDETHIKTLQPSPLDFALIAANVEGGDLSPGDLLALVRVLPWDAPLDLSLIHI